MTFLGETEHFSGKNGALRWSILVGKQKHNVQKPSCRLSPPKQQPEIRLRSQAGVAGTINGPMASLLDRP